jgi:hypothetical protein
VAIDFNGAPSWLLRKATKLTQGENTSFISQNMVSYNACLRPVGMQILKSLHALYTRGLHINLLLCLTYNKDLAGGGGGDGRKRLAPLSISRYGFWVKKNK